MNKGTLASITAIGVFSIMSGLSYPLLSLVLERNGYDAILIGLSAAMTPLGMVLSSPFIVPLSRIVGSCRLCICSLLTISVSFLGIYLVDSYLLWLPLRFVLGVGMNVVLVMSEAWINDIAEPRNRGKLIGLYTVVAALGFAVGPLILSFVGSDGPLPFAVGIVAVLAVIPILLAVRRELTEFRAESNSGVLTFFTAAPVLLFCVLYAALFDQTVLSMLPVHLRAIGLDETVAAQALTILITGNILLQVPIGWMADIVPRRLLLAGLSMVVVAGCALLNFATGAMQYLIPLLIIWGSAAFGIYTVALAELGARFSGTMLLAGSSAFALTWGIGGAIGPLSAGLAMNQFGIDGLPLLLGIAAAMVCGVLCIVPLCSTAAQRDAPD